MIARNILGFAAAIAALFAGIAPAYAAESIEGRWVTEEGDAVVLIGPCGNAICGTIAQFIVAPPDGADQRDINNPDPQLRQRRLLDTPILSKLREDGDSWKGEIYDPKRGRSFRSVVRRAGPGTLEVKGCAGPFCQTQTWRRAN